MTARKDYTRAHLIPNAPVREAYLAAGVSACEVCVLLGWRKEDTSRLHRKLGLLPYQQSKRCGGRKGIQTLVDREAAASICAVLGVDFDELYEGYTLAETPAAVCETCDAPMRQPDPEGICGLCREEVELFGQVAVAA